MVAPLIGPWHGGENLQLLCPGVRQRSATIFRCATRTIRLSTRSEISVPLFNRHGRRFRPARHAEARRMPGALARYRRSGRASDEGLRRVSILCGNGGLYLPQELARGADGAMTGFAYPGDARRRRCAVSGRRTRPGGGCVRRVPAAGPSRAAAGLRARAAQGNAVSARHHRVAESASAGPVLNATDREELTRLVSRVERNVEAL